MTHNNNKKRKRPRAKDWPPTSAQKKTLLPYAKRLKLPLLNEAPFVDVWVKIIQIALADCRNTYIMCRRKARQFRNVHKELHKATKVLREEYPRIPLRIRIFSNRILVESFRYSSLPEKRFKLVWYSVGPNAGSERLVWYSSRSRSIAMEVCVNKFENIFRFTSILKWKLFIGDFLFGRLREDYFKGSRCSKFYYNRIGPRLMEKMIQRAPKSLDRQTAKQHICEVIKKNPAPITHSDSDSDWNSDSDSDSEDEESDAIGRRKTPLQRTVFVP